MNHVAGNIGQPEVATGVAVRKLCVIKAKTVEHGCVQIMHVSWLFYSPETKIISSTINSAPFDTATGKQNCITGGIVIAATAQFFQARIQFTLL